MSGNEQRRRPVVLGVAGGSGSGKTTVVRRLIDALGGDEDVAVLHHDSYYRDASHLPPEERREINYDHPDSLETELLIAHLETLLASSAVQVPVYDFANHVRTDRTAPVEPRPVIILDGILDPVGPATAGADGREALRGRGRGRQARASAPPGHGGARPVPDSVLAQYMKTVRPMHLEFVEPSKRYADVIIPRGGHNRVGVDMVVATVRSLAASRKAGTA